MIEWILPIKTLSESNTHEHWSVSRLRHIDQKNAIIWAFHQHKPIIILPCVIKIIRIAPRKLDSDNLQSGMKWIRDALADQIFPGKAAGRADDSDKITWEYEQEKGKAKEYSVKIQIKALDEIK